MKEEKLENKINAHYHTIYTVTVGFFSIWIGVLAFGKSTISFQEATAANCFIVQLLPLQFFSGKIICISMGRHYK